MFPPFQLPGPLHWMKQLLGGSPLAAIGGGSGERLWAIVLGGLLAVVAISLLIASWTKWGQTKSLSKCIALAFLAHIWLLVYAYGTRIITPGSGDGSGGGAATPGVVSIQMSSGEETSHLPPASLLDSRLAAMDSQDELERSEREEPQNDALLNAPVDQQQTDGSTESKNAKAELDAWEKPLDLPSESLSHRLADIPMDEILQEPVAAQSEPIDAPTPALAPAMVPAVSPDLAEFEALLARAVPPSLPPPPPQSQPSHSQPSYLPPPPLANLPIASSMSNPSVSNRSVPPAARADTQSTYQNRFATNRMEIVRAGGGG